MFYIMMKRKTSTINVCTSIVKGYEDAEECIHDWNGLRPSFETIFATTGTWFSLEFESGFTLYTLNHDYDREENE